jgi:hypothetical protein
MPFDPQHTFFACVTNTVLYTGGEIKDALLGRTVRLVNIPVTGEKPRLGCAAPLLGGVFC